MKICLSIKRTNRNERKEIERDVLLSSWRVATRILFSSFEPVVPLIIGVQLISDRLPATKTDHCRYIYY